VRPEQTLPGRFGICDEGHCQRNRDAAGSREALVARKPFRQTGAADQSEGNGNDRRPQHAACESLQNFRESDQREAGPKAEDQNTQGDGHHTGRDQQSFRPHGIHKRAARHLTNQTSGPAYGEGKPYVFGGPSLNCPAGGSNRSKGGLHAGQKEVKPAQGKQTLLRRRSGFPQGPRLDGTHGCGYSESGGVRA